MHILLTNDDGPPSPHSSPYIRCLVDSLQKAGHTVSVCLPHTQRSWIGKAHMIGQTVKPLYYRPSEAIYGEEAQGTTHFKPSRDGNVEEWILVDGTPASCVQIGLHHFFQERGPIDLVVSGPNYGRNSTAVFALSSGTLGAALEAAACGQKAIALSFAFFSRNHDPVIIDGACRHSVRVIEALYKQWPQDRSVDLYTVNVPLVEGVEEHKTVWTEMLQNYWTGGSCFQEVEGSIGDEDEEEERIREGVTGEVAAKPGKDPKPSSVPGHTHKHFKWAPRFGDVYKSVEDSGPGSDGWEVKEGNTRYDQIADSSSQNSKMGGELRPLTPLLFNPQHHAPQSKLLAGRDASSRQGAGTVSYMHVYYILSISSSLLRLFLLFFFFCLQTHNIQKGLSGCRRYLLGGVGLQRIMNGLVGTASRERDTQGR